MFPNIAHLELWAIIIAIKLWINVVSGKKLHFFCDNECCVTIINSGRSKDGKLQMLLCELAMVCARNNVLVKMIHIRSKSNTLPDLLSRWYNGGSARREFKRITQNKLTRRSVAAHMFQITDF